MQNDIVSSITYHIQTYIHDYHKLLLEESENGDLNINDIIKQKTEELINTIKSIILIPQEQCDEYKYQMELITEDYKNLRNLFIEFYYSGKENTDQTKQKFQLFATQVIKLKDRLNKQTIMLHTLENNIKDTKILLNEEVQNKIDSMREEIANLKIQLERLHQENLDYSNIFLFLLKSIDETSEETDLNTMIKKIQEYIITTKQLELINNSIEIDTDHIEQTQKSLNGEIEENNKVDDEMLNVARKEYDELFTKYNQLIIRNKNLETYETNFKKLELELEDVRTISENRYEKLLLDYNTIIDDKTYLMNDLKNKNDEITNLKRMLENLHMEKDHLIDNLKNKNEEIAQLESVLQSLYQEKDLINDQQNKNDTHIEKLSEEKNIQEDKITYLLSKIESLSKENENLMNDQKNKNDQIINLMNKLEELDEEKNHLINDQEHLVNLKHDRKLLLEKRKKFIATDVKKFDNKTVKQNQQILKFRRQKLNHKLELAKAKIKLLEKKQQQIKLKHNKSFAQIKFQFDILSEKYATLEKKFINQEEQLLINDSQIETLQNENKNLLHNREIMIEQNKQQQEEMIKAYDDLEIEYEKLQSCHEFEKDEIRLNYENEILGINEEKFNLNEKYKILLLEYNNLKISNNQTLTDLEDKYNNLYDKYKAISNDNILLKELHDNFLRQQDENNIIAENKFKSLLKMSVADYEKVKEDLKNKHDEAEKFIEENFELKTVVSNLHQTIKNIELERDEANQKALIVQNLLEEKNADFEAINNELQIKKDALAKSHKMLNECNKIKNKIRHVIKRRDKKKVINLDFINKLLTALHEKNETQPVTPSDD